MKKALFILLGLALILMLWLGVCFGEEIDYDKMVRAIFQAEGGYKATYLYGIKSVDYKYEHEARQICYNSVRNNHRRWIKAGKPKDFISFMGDRYCPPTIHKLNKNWVKNVTYFYKENQ
ncbi:unnamed protein product [marine sediment metagenome]|uniref:Uncharacterized protein n=1 Tax=marine sediment metagenome TaxID=412755 RepID=X1PE69_9ZZZZ